MNALLRHPLTRFGGALAALTILCSGCNKEQAAQPVPVIKTHLVEARETDEEISASGVIEAVDKVELGFMVAGRVSTVDVEDGDTVKPGQLLASLDDSDLRNEVAIADGRLAEVRDRHARLAQLNALGSLTQADFEKIKAALTESEAASALAHRRLSYAEIRAPFAGRIQRHGVARGTVVAPGIPVCTLVGTAPVWATLSVPEVDVSHIHPGELARVSLAAAESVVATAKVEAVLPQAEAITRSFEVMVRIPNLDGAFRPGNVVTASIATGVRRKTVTLPPQLVQRYPDGSLYVWLVDAAGRTVTRRIVDVGRMRGTEVEVVAGLHAGERVVLGGEAPLFDGMRVEIGDP